MQDFKPWFTIWFKPIKTIDGVLNEGEHYHSTLLIIFIMSALANFSSEPFLHGFVLLGLLALVYAGVIAFITLLIFKIGKLFNGKASYNDVLAVLMLGLIPDFIPTLFDHLGIFSDVLSIVFGLWGMILFIVMFSHVERFSMWKTFVVYGIIIGLVLYQFLENEVSTTSDTNTSITTSSIIKG